MLAQLQSRIDRENPEREHPIRIAWGYAVQGEDGSNAQELYQLADARMYERKKEMKEKERQEAVLR